MGDFARRGHWLPPLLLPRLLLRQQRRPLLVGQSAVPWLHSCTPPASACLCAALSSARSSSVGAPIWTPCVAPLTCCRKASNWTAPGCPSGKLLWRPFVSTWTAGSHALVSKVSQLGSLRLLVGPVAPVEVLRLLPVALQQVAWLRVQKAAAAATRCLTAAAGAAATICTTWAAAATAAFHTCSALHSTAAVSF
jgi:hypothetical protein